MKHASVVLLVLLALAGCRECGRPAQAPSNYDIERLEDPYPRAPAKGSVSSAERVGAVLEDLGRQLGYGARPAEYLKANAGRHWAKRQLLFLSHGGTEQLRVAHLDLIEQFVPSQYVSPQARAQLRQSEARVKDWKLDEPPEETMRRVYLAEIAWCLMVLAEDRPPEAGAPAAG